MSTFFVCGEQDVWNPASGVARLFMRHVVALEELLGIPSGLSDNHADEVAIDRETLARFLRGIHGRIDGPPHRTLGALVGPSSELLCALYFRCTADPSAWPPLIREMARRGDTLLGSGLAVDVSNEPEDSEDLKIESARDFVRFLRALRREYDAARASTDRLAFAPVSGWENVDLSSFLEAMEAWVNAANPSFSDSTWAEAAALLLAGKQYE